MPNSRFALHGKRPSLIHGLCAFFASNSRFMHLSQAALDTPLDRPFPATFSVHGLHFTVCAPSIEGRNMPFREFDPLGVHPKMFVHIFAPHVRCANTLPFLCNELVPFQAISGNFPFLSASQFTVCTSRFTRP